jgi:hypothetical protein
MYKRHMRYDSVDGDLEVLCARVVSGGCGVREL